MSSCTHVQILSFQCQRVFYNFRNFFLKIEIENGKSSIFYRYGEHYEYPLLIQSVLMNLAMFALIHLCVDLNNKESLVKGQERIFTGEN